MLITVSLIGGGIVRTRAGPRDDRGESAGRSRYRMARDLVGRAVRCVSRDGPPCPTSGRGRGPGRRSGAARSTAQGREGWVRGGGAPAGRPRGGMRGQAVLAAPARPLATVSPAFRAGPRRGAEGRVARADEHVPGRGAGGEVAEEEVGTGRSRGGAGRVAGADRRAEDRHEQHQAEQDPERLADRTSRLAPRPPPGVTAPGGDHGHRCRDLLPAPRRVMPPSTAPPGGDGEAAHPTVGDGRRLGPGVIQTQGGRPRRRTFGLRGGRAS
jgi:hypothetical protein